MKQKILLDTDIGSDIDDALCLAYLLANPECELLGITTVTGQATKRAMIASALCKVAKKNIPIFPGAEKPLKIEQQQNDVPQTIALNKWEHETKFPEGKVISFLQQTIRSHPGEIILLCIGPMTNIARLFQLDSEIPSLLKQLVLMCGLFFNTKTDVAISNGREWNAFCDPDAAAIVYNAKVKKHLTVGLDVTHKLTMDGLEVKKNFILPLLRPVEDFSKSWFAENPVITFHDPLAAVSIFNPEVCEWEKGLVNVEIEKKNFEGRTYFKKKENGNCTVAMDVDKNMFSQKYFEVFEGGLQ